jgi:hypothetical protein
VRGWLARGREAFRLAGERSDLWLAGALGWLVFVGWLPLLLVVAPPDGEGIEAIGVSLYLSQSFPLNAVLLVAGAVAGFVGLCLLAATAEVAIEHAADPRAAHPPAGRATFSAFGILLITAVPVVVTAGLVLGAVLAVAPAEYLSADLATPVLLRIALRILPELGVLLLVLLAMQTVGGAALRFGFTHPGQPAITSLRAVLRSILARPWRSVGVATAGLLADGVAAAVTFGLLRLLWPPIGLGLGDGLRSRPETVLLLLGFVAVWLGLLLAAGALHVAISAWWAMEVGTGAVSGGTAGIRSGTSGPGGPLPGTDAGGPH